MSKRIDSHVQDYVVFDLETTGVSTKQDKIIEISALKVVSGRVVNEFSFSVNPERKIPVSASRVNRISDQMVQSQATIREVLPKFLAFVGDSILLGQNIQRFDLKLLERECNELELPILDNDYVETLSVSRKVLPQLAHHSLEALARHYGVSYKGAHRALADCYITHQVYQHLKNSLRPVPDSIPECPKCKSIMVLRNGKFREFWGCSHYPSCTGTRNLIPVHTS